MALKEVQYITDVKGKKTGVLLSLKQYQKMLEDLNDLVVIAERRNEPNVTLEEMKKRLVKDGLLSSRP